MPADSPLAPAERAKEWLLAAILDGTLAPGAALPSERELALQLAVTRPTLRAAITRLERDGWLTVQHGKSTRVRDYWREGGLNVLGALVGHGRQPAPHLITSLLEVRLALAPAYSRAAVAQAPAEVLALLHPGPSEAESPAALAAFDWQLHHGLTVLSGNPIYTLILNGFGSLYQSAAPRYFAYPAARAASLTFYQGLAAAALQRDPDRAEQLARAVMGASIELWQAASAAPQQPATTE